MVNPKAIEASKKFQEILQKVTFQSTNPFAGLTEKQIEEVTSIVQVTPGKTLIVFFRDEEGVVREFLEKLTTEPRGKK